MNKFLRKVIDFFSDNQAELELLVKGEDQQAIVNTQYADAIVLNEKGEILLLLRSRQEEFGAGKWSLPGGKIEVSDDSELVAAQRELQEETGLKEREMTSLGVITHKNGSMSHYYACFSWTEPLLLDNNEHYNYKWVSIVDLDKYDLLLDLKDVLNQLWPQIEDLMIPPPTRQDISTSFKTNTVAELIGHVTNMHELGIVNLEDFVVFHKSIATYALTEISKAFDESLVDTGTYMKALECDRTVLSSFYKGEMNEELLKGAKGEPLGTKKTWGSKDYIKTTTGWKFVGKSKGKMKDVHDTIHGKKADIKDILAHPEGKQMIEGIEGLDSKRADHKPLYQDYQKQLKDKFGYDYQDDSWNEKSPIDKHKEAMDAGYSEVDADRYANGKLNLDLGKKQEYSSAYGDGKFSTKEKATNPAGQLTKPENYSVVAMNDGSFIRTTNKRASVFEKQGDGKRIGKFDPNGDFSSFKESKSKGDYLSDFKKEYEAADDKDAVMDKYMEMDTDAFDSDDLNEVIDEVEGSGDKASDQNHHVSFDWRSSGIDEFNEVLEKLGADIYSDSDNIFISTKGKVPDNLKSEDGVGGEEIADAKVHWIQEANMDTDEIIDTYKAALKELGYKTKIDRRLNGSDMYGFDIVKKEKKINKGTDSDTLEKGGKLAMIGEVRTWGGKKYQREADGWTEVSEGGEAKPKAQAVGDAGGKPKQGGTDKEATPPPSSPEEHATATPTDKLKGFVEDKKADPKLKEVAQKELEQRGHGDLHEDDQKSLEEHAGKGENSFISDEKSQGDNKSKKNLEEAIPKDIHDRLEDYIGGSEDVDLDETINDLKSVFKQSGKELDEKKLNQWISREMKDPEGRLQFTDEILHTFTKDEEKGKESKVLGKTKSGQSIYKPNAMRSDKNYDEHSERTKDYTNQDHIDAVNYYKEQEKFHEGEGLKKMKENKSAAARNHEVSRSNSFAARRYHESKIK